MNYCSVATCIYCWLLLIATTVIRHTSISQMAAENVTDLLLCGYMYALLSTVDGDNRNV